jgi:hypothetical protein
LNAGTFGCLAVSGLNRDQGDDQGCQKNNSDNEKGWTMAIGLTTYHFCAVNHIFCRHLYLLNFL